MTDVVERLRVDVGTLSPIALERLHDDAITEIIKLRRHVTDLEQDNRDLSNEVGWLR